MSSVRTERCVNRLRSVLHGTGAGNRVGDRVGNRAGNRVVREKADNGVGSAATALVATLQPRAARMPTP